MSLGPRNKLRQNIPFKNIESLLFIFLFKFFFFFKFFLSQQRVLTFIFNLKKKNVTTKKTVQISD